MFTEQFKSVPELYRRVMPALKTRHRELERKKLGFITEQDIWNYLRRAKWARDAELTLFDVVDDILNVPDENLLEYIRPKLQK